MRQNGLEVSKGLTVLYFSGVVDTPLKYETARHGVPSRAWPCFVFKNFTCLVPSRA